MSILEDRVENSARPAGALSSTALPAFNARDPWAQQAALADIIKSLEPMRIGLQASGEDLAGRAIYIRALTKLVADHIECLMADADASISSGKIDETDAAMISDAGRECAGQLDHCADLAMEAA